VKYHRIKKHAETRIVVLQRWLAQSISPQQWNISKNNPISAIQENIFLKGILAK
jgi:hypothetical protein